MAGWRKEILFIPERGRWRLEPTIVILAGPSLSGKTTTAEALTKTSNLNMFDVDEYRGRIVSTLGADPRVRLDMDGEVRIQTFAYKAMHRIAGMAASTGDPVVISASYSQPHYREDLERLLRSTGLSLRVFMLNCPDEEIPARLESRVAQGESASTVRDENEVLRQRARYQEITEFPFLRVNTNRLPMDIAAEIMYHLRDLRKTT